MLNTHRKSTTIIFNYRTINPKIPHKWFSSPSFRCAPVWRNSCTNHLFAWADVRDLLEFNQPISGICLVFVSCRSDRIQGRYVWKHQFRMSKIAENRIISWPQQYLPASRWKKVLPQTVLVLSHWRSGCDSNNIPDFLGYKCWNAVHIEFLQVNEDLHVKIKTMLSVEVMSHP